MFRDSRGVVHTVSSADPLEDLPPGAVRALQAALLQPGPTDLGSVLERCDAVQELLERWQDAFFSALPDDIDVEEEARWAAEAGMSFEEVEAQYEETTTRRTTRSCCSTRASTASTSWTAWSTSPRPTRTTPAACCRRSLVTVLERELLLLPLRVRLEALVAAAEVVSTWADLVADHEKLLGHLVLAHGEPQAATGHEALVDRHAALHAATGPGTSRPAGTPRTRTRSSRAPAQPGTGHADPCAWVRSRRSCAPGTTCSSTARSSA